MTDCGVRGHWCKFSGLLSFFYNINQFSITIGQEWWRPILCTVKWVKKSSQRWSLRLGRWTVTTVHKTTLNQIKSIIIKLNYISFHLPIVFRRICTGNHCACWGSWVSHWTGAGCSVASGVSGVKRIESVRCVGCVTCERCQGHQVCRLSSASWCVRCVGCQAQYCVSVALAFKRIIVCQVCRLSSAFWCVGCVVYYVGQVVCLVIAGKLDLHELSLFTWIFVFLYSKIYQNVDVMWL